ncbi:MAG: nucleotidyltransferase family protein [Fimbriimonas sp.]
MEETFGIVILAAGESRRMGRPKQLLPYGDRTLIEHAVVNARQSEAAEIIVVVGAYAHEIRASLEYLGVVVRENLHWRDGMGGSIACGVDALSTQVAVIVLGDQPLVPAEHLRHLAELVLAGAPAAATEYGDVVGAPCAFGKDQFPRLMALRGENGARAIVRDLPGVVGVPLPEAAVDVDTPDDYRRLSDR